MKCFIKFERRTQLLFSTQIPIIGALTCCNTWETFAGTLTVTDWPEYALCELLAMMVCQ